MFGMWVRNEYGNLFSCTSLCSLPSKKEAKALQIDTGKTGVRKRPNFRTGQFLMLKLVKSQYKTD